MCLFPPGVELGEGDFFFFLHEPIAAKQKRDSVHVYVFQSFLITVTPIFIEPFPQAMKDGGEGGRHCGFGDRGFPGAPGTGGGWQWLEE